MKAKYVFIDRDGVINKDPGGWTKYGYVTEWKDFHFLPGALKAFKLLSDNGYESVIISNQQCVGKGCLSEESLAELTMQMRETIETAGGTIAGVYYCTHLKDEKCSCRKPEPGLFSSAQEELNIDNLNESFFVGDNKTDIIAGTRAGMKTILVLSGKSSIEDTDAWENKPDYICEDLLDAADLIVNRLAGYTG
ncbi:MAG: HAD-IIIA family hydrolase [Candidatus Omnitrophota bacterium]